MRRSILPLAISLPAVGLVLGLNAQEPAHPPRGAPSRCSLGTKRSAYTDKPYWDLERARLGTSREVPVEIVVNGTAVATQKLLADGTMRALTFEVPIERSSWIAARILPSAHTNPLFALVAGQAVRASRASAEWCLAAVNQCWSQKAPRIRASELQDARNAYDHARQVYKQRLNETK
jgi:hypothetical protein